ncbi:HEPN/Toprim-associated domain-containing protein [Membranihabitans marinus]|uniref:HEPN/Toprim-associated domain-containing protein n=1 Tax=Membranihabitans marinus TaxID=1227546 RepID=UPI001F1CB03D|nr:HEPN/Toprim-associated domain-containing protein [Membranihabitans marinus]
MGSYCELYISNYPISTTKNEIDPFLLSIFQPNDLVAYERNIGERFQLLYGRDDSVDEIERAIQYINTAQNLKERLNVVGFTMKRVEEAFENSKLESLERINEWIEDKTFNDNETIEKKLKEDGYSGLS